MRFFRKIPIYLFCLVPIFGLTQKANDPFYVSAEINRFEFIAKNQVDRYSARRKNKYSTMERTVVFNNWYAIKKVKEKEVFKKSAKRSFGDSTVVELNFDYDLSNANLTSYVSSEKYYQLNGFEFFTDTVDFTYDNGRITHYHCTSWKEEGNADTPEEKFIDVNQRQIDSIIYNDLGLVLAFRETITDDEGRRILSHSLIKPTDIDSLLNPTNHNYLEYVYNDDGMIESSVDLLEKKVYCYNKHKQLAAVVKTSNSRTMNDSTDREVLASPNAMVIRYVYDKESFLLKEILYNDKVDMLFSYTFRK